MPKPKNKIYNLIFIFLFLLAFLERTVFDLGPNIELLTSVMVLAAYFLGRNKTMLLTFMVMAFSDRLIGNSKIFLFTWSGFLIPALLLPGILSKLKSTTGKPLLKTVLLSVSGISANVFFYLYTNFGVWILDSWGMYEKNPAGLLKCYINGLPFLKNQIVSFLIFVPVLYVSVDLLKRLLLKVASTYQKTLESG